MTQEVMGQEMKIPMEMENTNRMVIEDVLKDGNISIVASYDAFFLKIKSDMIDTTGNVDAIIGKRKRTVINPLGTVIRSEVIDTIEQRDVSTFTSPGGLLQVLPEKPVSTGDTWTATRTDKGTAMGENGETKTHYDVHLCWRDETQRSRGVENHLYRQVGNQRVDEPDGDAIGDRGKWHGFRRILF